MKITLPSIREEYENGRVVQRPVRFLGGKPARVVLFGSRAKGTARPTSDADVLLLLHRKDVPKESHEFDLAAWDLRSAIHSTYYTKAPFGDYLRKIFGLPADVELDVFLGYRDVDGLWTVWRLEYEEHHGCWTWIPRLRRLRDLKTQKKG